MFKEDSLKIIQKMHETQTVTADAIIAWYNFYKNKLPKLHPDRSEIDLIRTVALWMELTGRGGRPPFPYNYESGLNFLSDCKWSTTEDKPSKSWVVGIIISIIGIPVLFLNWKYGLAFIVSGQIIHYIGYRLEGGSANSALYENEIKRVLEWHLKRR